MAWRKKEAKGGEWRGEVCVRWHVPVVVWGNEKCCVWESWDLDWLVCTRLDSLGHPFSFGVRLFGFGISDNARPSSSSLLPLPLVPPPPLILFSLPSPPSTLVFYALPHSMIYLNLYTRVGEGGGCVVFSSSEIGHHHISCTRSTTV